MLCKYCPWTRLQISLERRSLASNLSNVCLTPDTEIKGPIMRRSLGGEHENLYLSGPVANRICFLCPAGITNKGSMYVCVNDLNNICVILKMLWNMYHITIYFNRRYTLLHSKGKLKTSDIEHCLKSLRFVIK